MSNAKTKTIKVPKRRTRRAVKGRRTPAQHENACDLKLGEWIKKMEYAIPQSCTLDVADRGGTILEEVGKYINLTRERVRQIEGIAAKQLEVGMANQREEPT